MSNKKIRWVSFQSLIGGMMIGAEEAFGSKPLFTIDFEGPDKGNSSAYMHYMNNIKKSNLRQLVLEGGILSMSKKFKSEEDEAFFVKECHDIDVVSAVPICSGLSQANTVNDKSKATVRGSDAQQNNNMYGVAEFTFERIKPKVFIFENAPALFTKVGAGVREKLKEMGEKYGYSVTWVKTNTNKHGSPQYRSRTFGIFWKGDKCPKLNYVNKPHKNIADFLAEISPEAKYNDNDHLNNKRGFASGFYKFVKAKYGDNWREGIQGNFWTNVVKNNEWAELETYCDEKELKFVKHCEAKLAQGLGWMDTQTLAFKSYDETATVFHRSIATMVHPVEDRGFTQRELMKLMGMPDDFEYPDEWKNQIWISQNVPVMTSRTWHEQIKDYLDGKLEMLDESEVYFNNEAGEKPVKKKKSTSTLESCLE